MLSRIDQVKLFKGCPAQILLGPFLNTLSNMTMYREEHDLVVENS